MTTIKALTLYQPWATLVGIGAKRIETRSWSTPYRGTLAIHASAWNKTALLADSDPYRPVLFAAGYHTEEAYDLPHKAVVAVCSLIACYRIEESPRVEDIARGEHYRIPPDADSLEFSFGDYTPGRYAWILYDVRALKEPIPARGAMGLWNWTPPNDLETKVTP